MGMPMPEQMVQDVATKSIEVVHKGGENAWVSIMVAIITVFGGLLVVYFKTQWGRKNEDS